MTTKRFWQDPYLVDLDTRVASVDRPGITLEETNFFAYSGGQESDRGTINGFEVIEAKKVGTEILYTLDEGHCFSVGDEVRVSIDWPRRYHLMRFHFAAELVLELIYRTVPGIEKIGAHISEDKARIDFVLESNISPILGEISNIANALVRANLEIRSAFSDESTERRFWLIEGFSQVPCGGTHLRRTGEIGSIQLRRDNIGKGKERVVITLNDG